jgi:hypothetical protein
MKHYTIRAFSFFVLLSIIVLSPIIASGQDIKKSIVDAENTIDQELSSPFAKLALKAIVYESFEARVQLLPIGYEKETTFKTAFKESFQSLNQLLSGKDLRYIKKNITNEDINTLITSYEKNKEIYWSFLGQIEKLDSKFMFLKNTPQDLILRSQIYFSIILLGGNRKAWALAYSKSPGLPFCGP